MFFAFALALVSVAGGTLITYYYTEDEPLASRLCAGACLGFTALAFSGFILASFFGLTTFSIILAAALTASPLVSLRQATRRAEVRADLSAVTRGVRRALLHPTRRTTAYFIFYALISLLLWLAFDRAMYEQPDGIYTGLLNNYGDLPFHLSVITGFARGENFPPEDPTFAGARFTYPFIADFVAAIFVRAGASLRDAMFMENFLLALAFVGLLHRWALAITRDFVAALITPVLVLFGGGLGWWLLFQDARQSGQGILAALSHSTHAYTIIPETTWRWGNALTTLLIPQRSLLLGLPLAVIVFTQWWLAISDAETRGYGDAETRGHGDTAKGGRDKKSERRGKATRRRDNRPRVLASPRLRVSAARRMTAAGAAAGLLPLVHAHSFIVVMGLGACLALLFREWRMWAIFFVVAILIAAPQMWWVTRGSYVHTESFFGWHLGWDRGTEDVFRFWLRNTGLFIPLIIAAILWRGEERLVSRRLLFYYLPFTLCFIIPNFVKLAPWVWDNIKVIFYWYVASAPLVALLLARLLRGGWGSRATAALLFVSLTLAGGLDVGVAVSRRDGYREFDRDGIAFAELAERNIAPRAFVLHAPIHNHPIFLTGRRSLMGYPGHIWTHGIEYAPREAEIKRIYAGLPDAGALLAHYGIEYVVVSPLERGVMPVNDSFFEGYTKVGQVGAYRLYKITRP